MHKSNLPLGNNKLKAPNSYTLTILSAKESNEGLTTTDSEEYYAGFVKRPIVETDADRVTGDKVLGPTLKFVGLSAAFIGAFLLVFLASNGLI